MRLFKWSTTFRCSEESPVVPVWISLPFLPVHLVHCKEALFSIAAQVGKPLRTDHATALLNRPNVVRVLVEYDVSQEFIDKIWIEEGDEGFWQDVIFESEPKYCLSCKHLGHRQTECFIDNPTLRDSVQKVREKAKSGNGNAKTANARASEGIPTYVPVSNPPISTVMAPPPVLDSVSTTTSSVSAPATLSLAPSEPRTLMPAVSTQLPVPVSTTVPAVTSNRFAVLEPSSIRIALKSIAPSRVTVTVGEPSLPTPTMGRVSSVPTSVTGSTSAFQPPGSPGIVPTSAPGTTGISILSAGAPDFVLGPSSGSFTSSTTPVVAAVSSPYSVPLHLRYSLPPTTLPGPDGTVLVPIPISGTYPVAYNNQSESVPSNRSFAAGRFGSSHSARFASSEDESGGGEYDPYFGGEKNDGFPSEPEAMHENDCTRDILDSMGSESFSSHMDAYLDDGFQQVTRRSDRLRTKKAKGISVGSTVTGRKKHR